GAGGRRTPAGWNAVAAPRTTGVGGQLAGPRKHGTRRRGWHAFAAPRTPGVVGQLAGPRKHGTRREPASRVTEIRGAVRPWRVDRRDRVLPVRERQLRRLDAGPAVA